MYSLSYCFSQLNGPACEGAILSIRITLHHHPLKSVRLLRRNPGFPLPLQPVHVCVLQLYFEPRYQDPRNSHRTVLPSGMRCPIITFSLSPRRASLLPAIAAFVNTRVVSWKDAADMNESMLSDALVIPNKSGFATADCPPSRITLRFSSWNLYLSTCCP